MAKDLVIVESPAKARTISKMLGRKYKVMASVGHVRDLPKSRLGVFVEENFQPEYINIRGKGPVINELKKEGKKANQIYLATDNDREGEAISWHLAYILGLDENKAKRVSFNEVTKTAVKEAMDHPRQINLDLVDAQQGRRVLDRLVGYKISPILWKKVKGGLSAGRVQSAVVKIICDREEEIENFKPEEYWSIEADFLAGKEAFLGKYHGYMEAGKEKKFVPKNEDQVREILDEIDQDKFLVQEVKKGKRTRNPKPPYTTSTMQQEASRLINFYGRKTMSVAQQLYEGISIGRENTGLITYMRTDSTNVSDQARKEAYGYIADTYGKEYANSLRKYKSKGGAQEAHECIRPTSIFNTPAKIKEYLSPDQYKLYKMIWERFLASMMASAKFNTINMSLDSNGQIFKSTGSSLVFDGFLKLARPGDSLAEEVLLPELKKDDQVQAKEIRDQQHFTQPPARYTEASLIKTLEDLGIGRPSTYAPTISTILSRNYVQIEDKRLLPTELGRTVNELLTQYFPTVTDKEFTARLEDQLDKIADGKEEWKKVVGDFYQGFEKNLETAEEEMEEVEIQDQETDVVCEKCGRNMVIKVGRFGKFLACPGYPECKNTKSIVNEIGVKCPKCQDGQIIERRSKRGRTFYGCSNYPKCDFVSWAKPVDKTCPECGSIMTLPNRKNAKNYVCSNPECKHEVPMDEKIVKEAE